ncbi:hypothetical protein BJF78_01440 [Pseudonocardia sp. CNS-139]|nr:hypothetical protein BJF78_01440 [Pseudonocardia sp. CNS-139]
MNGAAGAAQLVELDRRACLRLLASRDVGRIVFTEAAMPAAHPVSYLLDGEEVVFRTGTGRTFGAVRDAVVAFQTDEIDRAGRTGWSVLGVGHAYEVRDTHRLAALAGRVPEPWAPRRGEHTIAVPLRHLTGRRVVRI